MLRKNMNVHVSECGVTRFSALSEIAEDAFVQ